LEHSLDDDTDTPSPNAARDERNRRVADAMASGRLEGNEPSPEFLADADDYVEGSLLGRSRICNRRGIKSATIYLEGYGIRNCSTGGARIDSDEVVARARRRWGLPAD